MFIITDTAGWSTDTLVFSKDISRQLDIAVEESDIILFVVDGKTGIHPTDIQIARQLKRFSKKKVILVVNKIDTQNEEIKGYEFYELGFDEIFFISASHGRNIHDLLDSVWNNVKYIEKIRETSEILKIVFVGKPNVGKSSLINAYSREERSIVHDVPGTTRDSITAHVKIEDKEYIVIDTAGLHRGSKVKDDMGYLSALVTGYAIEDADIAILVIDAFNGIGETEVKIARLLFEKKKPVIIAVNKWDLIEQKDKAAKYFEEQLRERIKFMNWADIIFISAKTGQRLEKIFYEAELIFKEYSKELPQEELSEVIRDAFAKKSYISKGRTLKLKNCVQINARPPLFIIFVNDASLVHFSYERFIENCLRKKFGFRGTPIVLKFRKFAKKN
jgi:GTP-binding protein